MTSLRRPVEPPRIEHLASQFAGRRFGELVFAHYRKQSHAAVIAALAGTAATLPQSIQPALESWLDEIGQMGAHEHFWRADCGRMLLAICERAEQRLVDVGAWPTVDNMFSMFQLVVLNFAYGLHVHASSKAFVQRSLGMGFWERLFNWPRRSKAL